MQAPKSNQGLRPPTAKGNRIALMSWKVLNPDALRKAPLVAEPFPHFIVDNLIRPEMLADVESKLYDKFGVVRPSQPAGIPVEIVKDEEKRPRVKAVK